MNPSRVATPLGVQTTSIPSPKSPVKPKLKADIKSGSPSSTHSSFGEKRPTSQAQNRNDFFNIIRKKSPTSHSADLTEPSCVASASCLVKLDEQVTGTSTSVNQEKDGSASCSDLERPVEDGNGATEDSTDVCEVPRRSVPGNEEESSSSDPVVPDSGPGNAGESSSCPVIAPGPALDSADDSSSSDPVVVPSEEELDLLRRLGWDENAEGDALTPEEIDDFVRRVTDPI